MGDPGPSQVPIAAETAYRLRRLIAERELGPGAKLPSERHLTDLFGVSRTSVRAALQELQAIGLIAIDPKRGAFVAGDDAPAILAAIRGWFQANKLSLPELVEFRRAIEPAAAAAAARRRNADDLAEIEACLAAMRIAAAAGDGDAFSAADSHFHRQVALASHNRLFIVLGDSVAETLRRYREAVARLGPAMLARSLIDHEAIAVAIAAGDVDAAERSMLRHTVDTVIDFRIVARSELE